MWLQKDVPYNS